MITTTFQVQGMTCGNCVKHVTDELTDIEGVSAVDIDLATGQTTVTSATEIAPDVLAAAVDEAGYELIR